MKKILATITALVLSMTLLTACSGIELANIAAKNKDITIEKGGTEVLELAVSLSKTDATQEETAKVLETAKITWTSADANIVETKENTITAKAVGSTVVTAKTEDGKFTADFNITVIVSPTGITAPEEIAIDIDNKEANPIGASVLPADATNVKIIYKSSDEKVATVDENGNITAVAKGSCIISSSIEESNSVSQEPVGTVDETIKAETKVTIKEKETVPAKTTGTTASTNKNQTSGSNAGTQSPATSKPATPPVSNPVTPPVVPPVAPPAPVAPEPPAPPAEVPPPVDPNHGWSPEVTPGEDNGPTTGGF